MPWDHRKHNENFKKFHFDPKNWIFRKFLVIVVSKKWLPGTKLVSKKWLPGTKLVSKKWLPGTKLVSKKWLPGTNLIIQNSHPGQKICIKMVTQNKPRNKLATQNKVQIV